MTAGQVSAQWSAEPSDVRRALGYVQRWTTVELLCAGHPFRRDHSAAERRAARLVLAARGYPRPVALLLSALALPTVRDAWDGGAGVRDVLRGWSAVTLIVAGVAGRWVARVDGAHAGRVFVIAGAAASLALYLASRRRGGESRGP